ncbi:MAG: hypothetical protein IJ598_09155 [Ruminococcus sp.]|nr:hypothetical protein [Ruminococcus sp.]
MKTKIAALLLCMAMAFLICGCSKEENSEIVGHWEATKVNINGETVSFAELDAEDAEFSFDFREDGSCRAVIAGIENNGTYTFNHTAVDISYGGKEEKLRYDDGVLTLTFYYNNEKTSYMFSKMES